MPTWACCWRGKASWTRPSRCYQQALALRPDYGLVYVNYANLLARKEQYEQALELYQTGVGHQAERCRWPSRAWR